MIQLTIDFLIQNTIWSLLTCGLVLALAFPLNRRPAVVHLACLLALVAMLTPPLVSIDLPGSGMVFHSANNSNSTGPNETDAETDTISVERSSSQACLDPTIQSGQTISSHTALDFKDSTPILGSLAGGPESVFADAATDSSSSANSNANSQAPNADLANGTLSSSIPAMSPQQLARRLTAFAAS